MKTASPAPLALAGRGDRREGGEGRFSKEGGMPIEQNELQGEPEPPEYCCKTRAKELKEEG